MWNQIKTYLARGIFKKEYITLALEREAFKNAKKAIEEKEEVYKKFVDSRTVTDMTREQLKGFDFSKENAELIADIPSDQVVHYLDEAVTIMNGDVFPYVMEYVKRKQVDETINEAETIEHVNFGRATLNGVSLIKEAMESLVTEYDERHKSQEPFDEHSAT